MGGNLNIINQWGKPQKGGGGKFLKFSGGKQGGGGGRGGEGGGGGGGGGGGAKLESTQELCLMTLKIDTKFE